MTTNCVYVLVANNFDGTQFYKIGVSTDLMSRIASVQTGCPIPISHVMHLPIPQGILSTKVERHLHRRFKAFGTSGEWFRFDMSKRADQEEFERGCQEVVNPILGKGWKWASYTLAELKVVRAAEVEVEAERLTAELRADALHLQRRHNRGLVPTFWPEDKAISGGWEPGKRRTW